MRILITDDRACPALVDHLISSFGSLGFTPTQSRTRRTSTKEFIESALKLADDLGCAKAGTDLGGDPSIIRNWRRERHQQVPVSRKRVTRLMRELGITTEIPVYAHCVHSRGRSPAGHFPVHESFLQAHPQPAGGLLMTSRLAPCTTPRRRRGERDHSTTWIPPSNRLDREPFINVVNHRSAESGQNHAKSARERQLADALRRWLASSINQSAEVS